MNKIFKLSEFLLSKGFLNCHFAVVKLAVAAEPFKQWFDGKDTVFVDLKASEDFEAGIRKKFPKILEMAKGMGAEDSEIKLSEGISGLPSRKKSLRRINSLFFEKYLEKTISESIPDFEEKYSVINRIISWVMSRHSIMSIDSFKQELLSDLGNESFDIVIKFLEENMEEISDVSQEAKRYISSPIHLKNIDDKVVAITKDPKHIIGMSPVDDWGSCMAVGGDLHEEVYREVVDGGFVAFLIDKEDVEISKPYARIWVRRLDSISRDISYAVPEDTAYGSDHPLFKGTLQSWIDSKQGGLKNVIGEFVLSGGRQSDTFETVHSIVSTEKSVELVQNTSEFFKYNDKVFVLKDYAVSMLRELMPVSYDADNYPDEHGDSAPIMRNLISGSTERINICKLIGNNKQEVIIAEESDLDTATRTFIEKAKNNAADIGQILDVFFTKKSLESAIIREKTDLGLENNIDGDKILVGDLSGSWMSSSIFEKESVLEVKSLMLPCLETIYKLAYDSDDDEEYKLSMLMSKNRFIRSVEVGFENLKNSENANNFIKILSDPEKRFSVDVFSAQDFEKRMLFDESIFDSKGSMAKMVQLAKENVAEEIMSGNLVPSENTINFMVMDIKNPNRSDAPILLSNLEYAEKIGFLAEYLHSLEYKSNNFRYFDERSGDSDSALRFGQLSTLIEAIENHTRNKNFDSQVDICKKTVTYCLNKALGFAKGLNADTEKLMLGLNGDSYDESAKILMQNFKNSKGFFSGVSSLCSQSYSSETVGDLYSEIIRYNSNLDRFEAIHKKLSGDSGSLNITFLPVSIRPERFLMKQKSPSVANHLKEKISSIKFKYRSKGVRVTSKVILGNRKGSFDILFERYCKILEENKSSFKEHSELLISSIDRDLLIIEKKYKKVLEDIKKIKDRYGDAKIFGKDRSLISAHRKSADNFYNQYRALIIMKSKTKNLMS